MDHTAMTLPRSLVLAVLAAALVMPGRDRTRSPYEADYTYELLKKSADGSVTAVEKGNVRRAGVGDGGGFTIAGIGRYSSRVRRLSGGSAVIEFTLPGGSINTFDVAPRLTTEQFSVKGEYGVRLTLDEIRNR